MSVENVVFRLTRQTPSPDSAELIRECQLQTGELLRNCEELLIRNYLSIPSPHDLFVHHIVDHKDFIQVRPQNLAKCLMLRMRQIFVPVFDTLKC